MTRCVAEARIDPQQVRRPSHDYAKSPVGAGAFGQVTDLFHLADTESLIQAANHGRALSCGTMQCSSRIQLQDNNLSDDYARSIASFAIMIEFRSEGEPKVPNAAPTPSPARRAANQANAQLNTSLGNILLVTRRQVALYRWRTIRPELTDTCAIMRHYPPKVSEHRSGLRRALPYRSKPLHNARSNSPLRVCLNIPISNVTALLDCAAILRVRFSKRYMTQPRSSAITLFLVLCTAGMLAARMVPQDRITHQVDESVRITLTGNCTSACCPGNYISAG